MLGAIANSKIWSALRPSTAQQLCNGWCYQTRRHSSQWQVSSHGRVKTSLGAISFGSVHSEGYRFVSISKQPYYVHRLVAAAFLDSPSDESRWQVNHLDRDRANNHVTNLEYVTPSENMTHARRVNATRLAGPSKLSKPVLWRPCGAESWMRSASQNETSAILGVPPSVVSQCCRGLRAHGFGNQTWYEIKQAPAVRCPPVFGEIWQAASYPGNSDVVSNLMVSNHGRVWSQTGKDNTSAFFGTLNQGGYCVVCKAGQSLLVHRLVAATFLGQPHQPDMHVNHKDSDRTNNCVNNLEYVTASENLQHSWRHGARAERIARSGKAVQAQLVGSQDGWQDFPSIKSAATAAGVCRNKVSRICKGQDTDRSWEFRFATQESLLDEEWRPVVLEAARRPSS